MKTIFIDGTSYFNKYRSHFGSRGCTASCSITVQPQHLMAATPSMAAATTRDAAANSAALKILEQIDSFLCVPTQDHFGFCMVCGSWNGNTPDHQNTKKHQNQAHYARFNDAEGRVDKTPAQIVMCFKCPKPEHHVDDYFDQNTIQLFTAIEKAQAPAPRAPFVSFAASLAGKANTNHPPAVAAVPSNEPTPAASASAASASAAARAGDAAEIAALKAEVTELKMAETKAAAAYDALAATVANLRARLEEIEESNGMWPTPAKSKSTRK